MKEYPGRDTPLRVLEHCTFSLDCSESMAVIGPSGSGKSTLLAILGTLEIPSSGHFTFDRRDMTVLSEKERALFRRDKVGFVFQNHFLLPQCSALENVLIPCLADGNAEKDDSLRAEELLAKVGLQDRMSHLPGELSGGECQRVAMVRALIRRPELILADEPTGNLDRKNADAVAQLLLDLARQENALLIMATHDPLLAAKTDFLYDLSLPSKERLKRMSSPDIVKTATTAESDS